MYIPFPLSYLYFHLSSIVYQGYFNCNVYRGLTRTLLILFFSRWSDRSSFALLLRGLCFQAGNFQLKQMFTVMTLSRDNFISFFQWVIHLGYRKLTSIQAKLVTRFHLLYCRNSLKNLKFFAYVFLYVRVFKISHIRISKHGICNNTFGFLKFNFQENFHFSQKVQWVSC